jgi:hypothetical protein
MKGDPKDEEELSDFVTLVMSHLEKRDALYNSD